MLLSLVIFFSTTKSYTIFQFSISITIGKILDQVPASHYVDVANNCLSAWKAIASGVIVKTSKDRQKYWKHWCTFASICKIDPFLQNMPPIEHDIIVTAFAAWVRTGMYGKGVQIKVQGVTDALSAISKTIQLAGQQSPIYRADNAYTLPIQRLVEGF
jgi:hypothetical protein